jgi:hypothetical protein
MVETVGYRKKEKKKRKMIIRVHQWWFCPVIELSLDQKSISQFKEKEKVSNK